MLLTLLINSLHNRDPTHLFSILYFSIDYSLIGHYAKTAKNVQNEIIDLLMLEKLCELFH